MSCHVLWYALSHRTQDNSQKASPRIQQALISKLSLTVKCHHQQVESNTLSTLNTKICRYVKVISLDIPFQTISSFIGHGLMLEPWPPANQKKEVLSLCRLSTRARTKVQQTETHNLERIQSTHTSCIWLSINSCYFHLFGRKRSANKCIWVPSFGSTLWNQWC